MCHLLGKGESSKHPASEFSTAGPSSKKRLALDSSPIDIDEDDDAKPNNVYKRQKVIFSLDSSDEEEISVIDKKGKGKAEFPRGY